jgi:hypothetical protein
MDHCSGRTIEDDEVTGLVGDYKHRARLSVYFGIDQILQLDVAAPELLIRID